MWHASAGEFTRVMTWLPNSQELVFAAGNVIVIMHSESLCMQACLYYVCLSAAQQPEQLAQDYSASSIAEASQVCMLLSSPFAS